VENNNPSRFIYKSRKEKREMQTIFFWIILFISINKIIISLFERGAAPRARRVPTAKLLRAGTEKYKNN